MGGLIPLADASRQTRSSPIATGLSFLIQLFGEAGAVASVQSGGVAYMAHVGGFIFGAVTARPFERFLRSAGSEA
jgi:membrane associated rhomboid family serine protease